MARLMKVNEATAARRRMFFDVRSSSDGITAITTEAGGQPQISIDGAAWSSTGIGQLVHMGNGRYYAEVDQAQLTAGAFIDGRYKATGTAETPARQPFQVVSFDPANLEGSINALLVSEHGDGSWQQKTVIPGVTPAGASIAITTTFTVAAKETFNQSFSVEGLDSTGWTEFVFAIKRNADEDDDDAALLIVRVTDPANTDTDGLIRLNGAAPPDEDVASIAVDDITPDTVLTVNVDADAFNLPPGIEYDYELVRWVGDVKKRLGRGKITIEQPVVRSPSAP